MVVAIRIGVWYSLEQGILGPSSRGDHRCARCAQDDQSNPLSFLPPPTETAVLVRFLATAGSALSDLSNLWWRYPFVLQRNRPAVSVWVTTTPRITCRLSRIQFRYWFEGIRWYWNRKTRDWSQRSRRLGCDHSILSHCISML